MNLALRITNSSNSSCPDLSTSMSSMMAASSSPDTRTPIILRIVPVVSELMAPLLSLSNESNAFLSSVTWRGSGDDLTREDHDDDLVPGEASLIIIVRVSLSHSSITR